MRQLPVKKIGLIVITMLFGYAGFSQKDDSKAKAEIMYELPKHLDWKLENNDISIAVVGGDKDVLKQLSKLSKKKYPYGKSFTSTFFMQPADLMQFEDGVNIIYIGKEFNAQLPQILKYARVTGAVLVSENWDVRKDLMINFKQQDGKLIYEYNAHNLIANEIVIAESFKKAGGKVIDDRSLLDESETNLEREREKVRSQREEMKIQEQKLAFQLKQIKKQTETIEAHKKEIEHQQKLMDEQRRQIELQKQELAALILKAEAQNKQLIAATNILKEKEHDVEIQTQKLNEQKAKFDEQQKILEKQKSEIEERQSKIQSQKLEITAQTGIIKTQKNALTIFSVLLAIILVLVFFVVRSNRVQRKQNKLLAEQKSEIEYQAKQMEEINKELAKLSIVASETSNAVAILDQKGRFEWLNAGYTRMHGYTLQLLRNEVGNSLSDVNSHPKIEEILRKSIEQKSAVTFESESLTRQGGKIWAQTTVSPTLNAFGEVDKLVLIDSDITDIKKAEEEIATKNEQITKSILYAERIQRAVLTPKEIVSEYIPEHFVMFRPRDIVSGDFYWAAEKENILIVTAADCTGHGVPGAFMSMLGISFLNQIIAELPMDNLRANVVLDELRDKVKKSLRQTGKEGEAKDGMDMALCIIDKANMKMNFAGAQNSLVLIRNKEIIQYQADDQPIGISYSEHPFTIHELDMLAGDTYYIFSDGYADQFGEKTKKKFFSKRLREMFLQMNEKPMTEQLELLETTFDEWKGARSQMDDVLVMGLRIS